MHLHDFYLFQKLMDALVPEARVERTQCVPAWEIPSYVNVWPDILGTAWHVQVINEIFWKAMKRVLVFLNLPGFFQKWGLTYYRDNQKTHRPSAIWWGYFILETNRLSAHTALWTHVAPRQSIILEREIASSIIRSVRKYRILYKDCM